MDGSNNGQSKRSRFEPGNAYAFKPGQSGNPGGRPKGVSLRALFNRILAGETVELKDEDGKTVQISKLEALARRVVSIALTKPSTGLASLQKACIELLCDRFDPPVKRHQHQVVASAAVGVTITPAARMMQERCLEFATVNDGELTLEDYRRIRDSLPITDEDLGIENDDDGKKGEGDGRTTEDR
ncbi:MAG: hypothetical protein JSU86_01785 [Phycisphaerales bacterium]|nr:MAG: hypothetical protein JSU86_01785 [Phycisphaerales bacterium]